MPNRTFETYLIEKYSDIWDGDFNGLLDVITKRNLIKNVDEWASEQTPIEPSKARKELDCIKKYREALEEIAESGNTGYESSRIAQQALEKEPENG